MNTPKGLLAMVHPPRTGGTSVAWQLAGGGLSSVQEKEKHWTGDMLAAKYPDVWAVRPRILCVRNPYHRAISLYYMRTGIYRRCNYWAGWRFEDFVRKTRHAQNEHALLMSDYAGPHDYNLTIRYEHRREDLAALSALTGVPVTAAFRTPKDRTENRRPFRAETLLECEAAVDAVRTRFAEDFEMFGYDPEEVPRCG